VLVQHLLEIIPGDWRPGKKGREFRKIALSLFFGRSNHRPNVLLER
jgi:hypothetical protein